MLITLPDLENYPDPMSKEQFRCVAHISKRTARYYLQNGLVPCYNTGKKTRNYKISKQAVLAFLKDRIENPEKYRIMKVAHTQKPLLFAPVHLPAFQTFLMDRLCSYPDVMSLQQVGEFLGYERTTIGKYCSTKKLQYLVYRGQYLIPKPYLVAFLLHDAEHPRTAPRSPNHDNLLRIFLLEVL